MSENQDHLCELEPQKLLGWSWGRGGGAARPELKHRGNTAMATLFLISRCTVTLEMTSGPFG